MFLFAGKILLFYAIFYAVLAAFALTLWFLFASTLVETNPKYKLEESCIGATPGLGFRPTPPESTIDSTLIWFEKNNENNSAYWVKELDSFLKSKHDVPVGIARDLRDFSVAMA